jgi:hypothetical protein
MADILGQVVSLFDDLIAQGEQMRDACKKMYFTGAKKAIDPQVFEAWRTSCLTLLRSTFGTSSPHYDSFTNVKFFDHYNSTLLYLGILQGAREDLRKGYFYHKDLMLSVNIFNSFLAHALEFCVRGEREKAVGVLESVVIDALRKLAESHGITPQPSDGIADVADALARSNAIPAEARESLLQFQSYLGHGAAPSGAQTARGSVARDDGLFEKWHGWTQKFLYEYLGARIVIVN